MKLLVLTILELASMGLAQSSFMRVDSTPRSLAMRLGGEGANDDPFGFVSNPAMLHPSGRLCAAMSVSPGLFGMPELRVLNGALEVSIDAVGVGMDLETFGFTLYSETTLCLAASFPVNDCLTVGGAMTAFHVAIPGYGEATPIGCSCGMDFRPLEQVRLGCAVLQINRPHIGRSGDRVPAELKCTLAYAPLEGCEVACQLDHEENGMETVSFGTEYRLAGILMLRAGIEDGGQQYGCGVGIAVRGWRIDYGLAVHAELGCTHAVGLVVFV